MKPRQLSVIYLLLALFTLTACSPVGDKLTVVSYSVQERTFRVPGPGNICLAQIGAALTVLKTYQGSGGGCYVTHIPDYYVEYSTAGIQEFLTKYGKQPEEAAGVESLPPLCANRDLLVVDERNYDELREDHDRFLDYQEELARHAAFEKQVIEEQKQTDQVEKE